MSMLNPILMLDGKRKEIFDIIFNENTEINFTKQTIANILLNFEDSKLDNLKEEVISSNNKIELLINKGNEMKQEKIDIPSNIQL